jgi:hypothetical protein
MRVRSMPHVASKSSSGRTRAERLEVRHSRAKEPYRAGGRTAGPDGDGLRADERAGCRSARY